MDVVKLKEPVFAFVSDWVGEHLGRQAGPAVNLRCSSGAICLSFRLLLVFLRESFLVARRSLVWLVWLSSEREELASLPLQHWDYKWYGSMLGFNTNAKLSSMLAWQAFNHVVSSALVLLFGWLLLTLQKHVVFDIRPSHLQADMVLILSFQSVCMLCYLALLSWLEPLSTLL